MIDYKDLDSKKSTKKRDTKKQLKIAVTIFAAVFVVGLFSAFAYYYAVYTKKHYVLKYIAVTGNKILSVDKIKHMTSLDKTASMYDFSEKRIYSELLLNPWIKKAYVAKLYPDTIYIKVEEWVPKGVVSLKKKIFMVTAYGHVISRYKKGLNINISELPHIVMKDSGLMKDFLIASILNIYEKLDKFDKINYIEVISDSYQLVHFANSLNVAVNSLNCPKKAFVHLNKEWNNLVSKRDKLDSVSICFANKFVLRWKKEK